MTKLEKLYSIIENSREVERHPSGCRAVEDPRVLAVNLLNLW